MEIEAAEAPLQLQPHRSAPIVDPAPEVLPKS